MKILNNQTQFHKKSQPRVVTSNNVMSNIKRAHTLSSYPKSYYILPTKISFGSTSSQSAYNDMHLCHCTGFFREDMDWNKLTDYIINEYPKGCKINNYASSDGSEPYTISILLKEKLGENADKFFPIKASDKAPYIIDRAQKGFTVFYPDDKEKLNKNLEFFERAEIDPKYDIKQDGGIKYVYKVKAELKKTVDFNQADILKESANPYKKPCIVLFRHANYLFPNPKEDSIILIENLSKNLKSGSTVIIGESDCDSYAGVPALSSLLIDAGFKPIKEVTSPDEKYILAYKKM